MRRTGNTGEAAATLTPQPASRMHATPARQVVHWLLAGITALCVATAYGNETTLQRERAMYRETLAALQSGNRALFLRNREQLRNYPLFPYLELEDLRRRIRTVPTAEVDDFLQRHAGELPALRLREAWLGTLEARGRWSDFVRFFDDDTTDLQRRCHYAMALAQTGDAAAADRVTAELWSTPRSLPTACDPIFATWMSRGNPSPELAWTRFEAAMNAGQDALARYLLRFLDGRDRSDAELFLQIAANPSLVTGLQRFRAGDARHGRILDFALTQLAAHDVRTARGIFERALHEHATAPSLLQGAAARIARALAQGSAPDAVRWSIGVNAGARNEALAEDTVRLALRVDDWDQILATLDLLPTTMDVDERWQYWNARARDARGDDSSAAAWAALARTRSWYGFLAADHLGAPYAMQHRRQGASPSLLDQVSRIPGIARAREFALSGATLSSRREWLHTIRQLDAPRQAAAAQLATQWGWHQLAIMTLAAARDWDALDLRFPVVHRNFFDAAARRERVDPTWLYAIARQESALDAHARSPVGALGLMQVMPATAVATARRAGIPYHGNADLLDPERNVRIGSSYMRMLLDRFGQNRILAAAAYNAGPGRIGQWLQRFPADVEHDRFVETIPFRETRQYVQNVLSYAVIYAYLEDHEARLVQPHERLIHNPHASNGQHAR